MTLTTMETSKPHLSFTYVMNFKEPDSKIRFEQALAEKIFGSIVNGQSLQTNVPDAADPQIPRISFHSAKKTIVISQLAVQIELRFHNTDLDFEKALAVALSTIRTFTQKANEFKPVESYGMHGLVLDLTFPCASSTDLLAEYLYGKLIKMQRLGDLASINIQLGFKRDGLFLNVTSDVYESHQIAVGAPLPLAKPAHSSVVETGIHVRVDANNIPSLASGVDPGITDRLVAAVEWYLETAHDNIFVLPLR